MTSIFKDRNCIKLPRPMNEEEELRHLSKFKESDFRSDFRKEFAKLREELEKIPTKKIYGTELTGITAATLAMKYINAINEEGVSNINSTWEEVVVQEYDRMYEEAKTLFSDIVIKQFHVNKLPYEEKDITLVLAKAKDKAISIFKNSTMRSEEHERENMEAFELYYD